MSEEETSQEMDGTLLFDDARILTFVLRAEPVGVASATSVDKRTTRSGFAVVVPFAEVALAGTRLGLQATRLTCNENRET